MISSSSPSLERALDSSLLVYCVLQGNPARSVCEQFLRGHSGWFTAPLVLFEAKSVLTKVYGVDSHAATQQLAQFATVPVTVVDLDAAAAFAGLQLADTHGVDLTDAVLLYLVNQHGARYLATEDQHLAQVGTRLGITPQTPFDTALRQQVAAWEAANLVPKGMARVLRRVHQWLSQAHAQAAQDFWSQTGGGSHLP